ncbi:hypothetical protein C5167_021129 [Papaver somniferum]|uniref:Uncharacterized protein n=1 Tax=Papaver somniferum TaxID=3469 RepID=A0A4Y7IYW5_PAPSO|nr:hypothetical protein C5167_021129 [Papaver somniferum]
MASHRLSKMHLEWLAWLANSNPKTRAEFTLHPHPAVCYFRSGNLTTLEARGYFNSEEEEEDHDQLNFWKELNPLSGSQKILEGQIDYTSVHARNPRPDVVNVNPAPNLPGNNVHCEDSGRRMDESRPDKKRHSVLESPKQQGPNVNTFEDPFVFTGIIKESSLTAANLYDNSNSEEDAFEN